MKVLMVLDREFPPDIRVENEIEALQEAGHEIHLACYTRKDRKKYEVLNNIIIHRKSIGKFFYKSSVAVLKFPFYFNFWHGFIKKLQRKYNFDTIHIHDLPLAKIGFEISRQSNIPFILDLHENWPAYLRVSAHTNSMLGKLVSNNAQWEKYELKYCKLATVVIVVVDEAKERLASLGIKKENIRVVSNTINYSRLHCEKTKTDKYTFTLTYAGAINEHRGLQVVLKAIKLIDPTQINVQLNIVGSGSYLPYLEKLSSDLGISKQINFAGWKPFDEMLNYIYTSNICIIPHRKSDHTDSTIPHKLFQYMYFSKPVIASDCTPIQRILEDTNSGLIFIHDDPEDLAKKIIKLATDPDLYNSLSVNGKPAVMEKYNWPVDAEVLKGMYQLFNKNGQ